ncbi:hypothetical protein FISHEDRAFT_60288 [Fistulina hepatica ATCC 64428]|uniref:Uncharacterized protein n=1 Tax=Fistulina hepatica ATCC 64428 TaxID=1128425 RepID=A0A0D7A810_9AGAR|nr:hypothetical protein FISHEDRAFT_60288 [Fistulina hepatica ATCC 64428]
MSLSSRPVELKQQWGPANVVSYARVATEKEQKEKRTGPGKLLEEGANQTTGQANTRLRGPAREHVDAGTYPGGPELHKTYGTIIIGQNYPRTWFILHLSVLLLPRRRPVDVDYVGAPGPSDKTPSRVALGHRHALSGWKNGSVRFFHSAIQDWP